VKIAAIFLSLFLLSKPLLPLLEYAAFYDYICHLAKQIVKAGDSENGNEKNQSFKVEISIVYFQETTHNDSVILSKDENFKISTSYNNTYKFHYTDVVFHPPLV